MNSLFLTCLGVFVVSLDTTILYVAFPSIQASFPAVPQSQLAWVINIYTILFGSFLIPAGAYADQWGRKRFFAAGIFVFTLASVLCGTSPDVPTLVACRGFQALGAALLVPSSLALVLASVPLGKRAIAVSIWGATGALAAAFGPSFGSLIIDNFGWRYAFFINLPIGIFALLLTLIKIPESRAPHERMPSLVGSALIGATLILFSLAAMDRGHGARSLRIVMLGGALASFALFLVVNQRSRNPAVDFSLFRNRTTLFANIGALFFSVSFTGMFFGSVLFLGRAWHYSTLRTGLAMTPGPLIVIPAAILGGKYAAKSGHRRVILLGAVLYALGMLQRIFWPINEVNFVLGWLPGTLFTGLGVGLLLPSFSAAATFHLPKERYAMGSGINNTLRQMGSVVGVILVVVILKDVARFQTLFLTIIGSALLSGLSGFWINTQPSPQVAENLFGGAQVLVVESNA